MTFEDIVIKNQKKSYTGSVVIAVILILVGGFMIWGRAVISVIFGVIMIISAVGLLVEELKTGTMEARVGRFFRYLDTLGKKEEVLAHINQLDSYPFMKKSAAELRFDAQILAYAAQEKVFVFPTQSIVSGYQHKYTHFTFGLFRAYVDHTVRLVYRLEDTTYMMHIACAQAEESKKLLEAIHAVCPQMVIEAPKEDGKKREKREPKFKK